MPHRNEYHPSQPAGWLPEPAESFFSDRTPMQAVLLMLDSYDAAGRDRRAGEHPSLAESERIGCQAS